MTTATMGTNAQNTLTALAFNAQSLPADFATIAAAIKDDQKNGLPIWPGAFSGTGRLYIPNRGVLNVLPGDYVAVDSFGWPILVSSFSAGIVANWRHT
jgi:hypothetical protein